MSKLIYKWLTHLEPPYPSAFLWRLELLFLLITSRYSDLKKGQSRYVQANTASAWPTRQYRQALHSAESEESKSVFLSPPSLVPESGQLAKGNVKNLCEDAVFKCSSFLILLPQNSAFPDLFRNMLICRKPTTGSPNWSLQSEESGDPAASQRAALLHILQIHLSALQKWKQQLGLLPY